MKTRTISGLFIFLLMFIFSEMISAESDKISKEKLNSTDLPYVILTNFSESSPYYAGVTKLKNYRQATVVHFNGDVFSVLDILKGIQPKFVAIMVSPTDIDEGFAFKIFTLAKQMDTDFDTDFSYGFITGNTPLEVENYIDNVINYENDVMKMPNVFRCFYRTGTGALGNSDQNSENMVSSYTNLGLESQRINTDNIDHETVLSNIKNSGIIHFFLHGGVQMVTCLVYNEIPDFGHPVMVFNVGCFAGCSSKWYNQNIPAPSNNYEDRAVIVNPEYSLAINFMKKGALAYYGHMCMWGFDSWPQTLTNTLKDNVNKSTGELLLSVYNMPSGPSIITDTVGTMPNDLYGMDNNRFYYSAIILYGDPAVKFKILSTPTVVNNTYVDKKNREITIYPNPTKESLTIDLKMFESKNLNIEVTDMQGTLIYYESIKSVPNHLIKQIDISGNNPGAYLVKIKVDNEVYNKKFIIE